MAGRKPNAQCECVDVHDGHPIHRTECADVEECHVIDNRCTNVERLQTLYRIDTEDRSGTVFCGHCASDAEESGLFSDGRS